MAGLWNRLKGNAADDAIPAHILTAALSLRETGVITSNTNLHSFFDAQLITPLTVEEKTDLTNLVTVVTGLLSLDKARWLLRLEHLGILIEAGSTEINETNWRSTLGIGLP